MTRPADWWTVDGTRHAFPAEGFPFRSFCGEARWSAHAKRMAEAPTCESCAAVVVADEPVAPSPTAAFANARPLTPAQKRELYRRRWHEAHGHR